MEVWCCVAPTLEHEKHTNNSKIVYKSISQTYIPIGIYLHTIFTALCTHVHMCTGEAQFERHRFLGPKNGPEDFAGEPNFLCRVCDTGIARQKSFIVLFLWRTKHVTISSFPLQMPAKSIVTRLKHVTNARRATRKCQISLSHKPGTVETVRFPRKMLLEQGWTCEKMPLSWKMHRTHH